ncbi:hypothetical protein R6242_09155 [Iodobacter sp. CM08]|uniref:hypothetical protein n=1 Tax=Iodobacter sp. CM08 TaxID=3085902 RepID=UPI0029825319|nr:hypothetical protein [Iodobacter sp. CM08]MDW5416737.1 hypothetical protein [Iodobacter sp. CM08]
MMNKVTRVQAPPAQIGYLTVGYYLIGLDQYTYDCVGLVAQGAELDPLIRQKLGGLGYEF